MNQERDGSPSLDLNCPIRLATGDLQLREAGKSVESNSSHLGSNFVTLRSPADIRSRPRRLPTVSALRPLANRNDSMRETNWLDNKPLNLTVRLSS